MKLKIFLLSLIFIFCFIATSEADDRFFVGSDTELDYMEYANDEADHEDSPLPRKVI